VSGAAGKHDLYLRATGGSGYLFNIEWWKFNFITGQDVGAVGVAGGDSYSNGVFTVTGAGADIGGMADAFHAVLVTNNGDCTIAARVASVQNIDPWSKAGVIIGESTNAGAANAFIGVTPGNGITWQYRLSTGGVATTNSVSGLSAPCWVELVRSGNTITGYSSADGTNWTMQGSADFAMAPAVRAGLAVCSHNNSSLCTATFDNVTAPGLPISIPPAAPGGLVAAAGIEQAALRWGAASRATSYNVKRATTSGGPYATVANVAGTNYTDAGVTGGTVYFYVVSALNVGGESGSTAEAGVVPKVNVPTPWLTQDIGAGGLAGGASFTNGVFTVTGCGADIWSPADEFRFVQVTNTGNGTVTARVTSIEDINAASKAGVMIRAGLANNAAHALVALTPGDGVIFQYRSSAGGGTVSSTKSGLSAPYWVRLVRSGNTFSGYCSPDGANWTLVGSATIAMAAQEYAGLAVSGHDANTLCPAIFDHVTAPGWAPPPASVPSGVVAVGGIERVALSWTPSSNANSYNVYRAATSGGPYTFITNLTATNYLDGDLAGRTNYYYVVTALSSTAGESGNSAEIRATPSSNVPLPWTALDIGPVGAWGSEGATNGVFTLTASGADIWNASDAFRFIHVTANGNATMVARVASLQNVDPWSKAGVMIRDGLGSNAANVFIAVTPGNGVTWQCRASDGGSTVNNNTAGLSAPYWVKLVRSGTSFTGYYSANGASWTQLGSATMTNISTAYIGLAVTSHNNSDLCTATFDNVTAPGWPLPLLTVNAVATSSNQINLAWTVVTNATGYNVKRSLNNGGPYTVLAGGLTATNYQDAGLAGGTTYYYEVGAVVSGRETNSPQVSATTMLPPTLLGRWLSGGANFGETSGYSPAGTFDGFAAAGGGFYFTNDVPPNATGVSVRLNNSGLGISNTCQAWDAGYASTFDRITNSFSVMCWSKGWPGTWNPWVSKYGESERGWQLRMDGTAPAYACWTVRNNSVGTVTLGAAALSNPDDLATRSIALGSDGNWHHYAGIFDAGSGIRRLYVDGVLAAEETGNAPCLAAANNRLMLGAKDSGSTANSTAGYGNYFTGNLFDVRVYGGVVSLALVRSVAGFTPPSPTSQLAGGNQLVLSWSWGTLLQATNLLGPWTPVSAAPPYTNNQTGAQQFFRISNP
jgi:fibronectin type 3 domain-containing protein